MRKGEHIMQVQVMAMMMKMYMAPMCMRRHALQTMCS